MLPCDSYEANKIASSVAHVDVSSAKFHEGGKIYSHPQKNTYVLSVVTRNTTVMWL